MRKKKEEVEIKIETIHDKYRKYINQHKSGYVNGLEYGSAIEILRYCESRLNQTIPMNLSCGTCIFDLIKLFSQLEEK